MKYYKYLFALSLTVILSISAIGCKHDDPAPTALIFNDVDEIVLYGPDHGDHLSSTLKFFYDVPDGVEYLVVGIFDAQIETSGKTIINEANWKGGSRTNLAGFTRGELLTGNIKGYDPLTHDFTTSSPAPALSGSYYWAVWGYDKYMNLTHASPQWIVIIP